MCVKYESCRTYTFYMVKLQRFSIFHLFVYKSMGASSTGASSKGSTPTTIYNLMHNFIISYRVSFNLSLLKKGKNLSLIWY